MDLLKHRADAPPLFPAASPRDPIVGAGKPKQAEGRWLALALTILPAAAAIAASVVASRTGSRETFGAVAWLSFGLASLVSSVGGGVVMWNLFRDRRERVARSVRTTGIVTTIDIEGVEGQPTYSEIPVVRFTTVSGHELEVRSDRARSKLSEGDTVAIRYDPRDSAWMMVTDGERFDLALVHGIFVAGSLFSVGVVVYGAALLAAA